jgi:SAM-dependent methyltransferase
VVVFNPPLRRGKQSRRLQSAIATKAARPPAPRLAFRAIAGVVGSGFEVAMPGQASEFVGDIPAHYDAELGPNIFEGYAADMAARAKAFAPTRTLELAAGTGIVSRKLRDALTGELVVTDLNAPMLDVARGKFRADEEVRFEVANAMALPFPDAAFDLVVCQFGVMFFPDKTASYREALRVLKPGGRYLLSAWGTHAQNPFAGIAHETVSGFFPDNPPGFYRVPFSYADATVAIGDLKDAGFTHVTHESVPRQRQVVDLDAFARGLVYGNPLRDEIKQCGGDADELVEALAARFRSAWGAAQTMPLLATIYCAAR